MADTKELLELKIKSKKKKPVFLRQDYHKKVRLENKWRKPKGMHSKLRLAHGGHRKLVSIGYGSPAAVKHMTRKGLFPVLVHTPKELAVIDKDTQGIIIASVGNKKKIEIMKEAQKKGIVILNHKDPSKFVEDVEKKLAEKRQMKASERKKKEEKVKEKVAKDKDKKGQAPEEGLAGKVDEEDEKRKAEKEEKDKLLTKRMA